MTAPLGLKFGRIVGRFLANTADGVDSDDMPEFEPLSGTVTIKAEPFKILVPQGDPDPATVVQLPEYYTCTLDDEGYLINQGERGVRVIAPTPGTTNPDSYTYRVSFDLYYGATKVPIPPYSFYVAEFTPGPDTGNPDAGSVGLTDLAKVSPVPGSMGNAVTSGVSVISVALVGNALVFSLSDGSTLPPVTVPQIEAASDSADAAEASAAAASASAVAAEDAVNSFDVTVGTVTTGAPGSPAAASVSGGPPAWTLDLTIPQGPKGDTGDAGTLATDTTAGVIQLAGDIAGPATAPTVPGLAGKAALVHTHTASQISDSTATGRSVLTATDAAAARTAIGAGTSSLTLGTTGSTAAAGNDSRLSDTRTPTAGTSPYDLHIVVCSKDTVRASGTGDFPFGLKLQRAITATSVTVRAATADASGNLVVELRKNGTAVSGTSTTVAAANQVAGGSSTGTWAFAAGDILLPAITGVGTTPGKGLIVEIKAVG